MGRYALDMEKYAEINELTGRFYAFSVSFGISANSSQKGCRLSLYHDAAGKNRHFLSKEFLPLPPPIFRERPACWNC